MREVFEQTATVIGFHHNLYTLATGRLHFPIRFDSTFRFLRNHAYIIWTGHLVNTDATIQGYITANRFAMYRLTTLGNMQFHIVQTIN
ncbi:hypothetical protein SDC9_147422 [bioreactor metagenome]|uniref:Uncharacterized protein n=1 Tax=bioreactor metagenome TaxID=1076179 RepID=A0A645EE01_9ZZZZ